MPGRLYPITVQYMAESDSTSQRRSNEARKELASKGFKRRVIERIDPAPYLRYSKLSSPAEGCLVLHDCEAITGH